MQIAKLSAAVVVMSGYPALPWGQQGRMPVPPSLEPLVTGGHATVDQLQRVIDRVCRLDSSSPPMLLQPLPALSEAPSSCSATASAVIAGPAPLAGKRKRAAAAADPAADLLLVPSDSVFPASRGELRRALEWGLAAAIM
jgi:hypothetical protein